MAYTILDDGGILICRFSGTLQLADLEGVGRDVIAIEASRVPGTVPHRVTDMTDILNTRVTGTNVRALAETVRVRPLSNPVKSAIVAPDAVRYGYARMFQILNTHPQVTVALFPTMNEALLWIAAPGFHMPAVPWEPFGSDPEDNAR